MKGYLAHKTTQCFEHLTKNIEFKWFKWNNGQLKQWIRTDSIYWGFRGGRGGRGESLVQELVEVIGLSEGANGVNS